MPSKPWTPKSFGELIDIAPLISSGVPNKILGWKTDNSGPEFVDIPSNTPANFWNNGGVYIGSVEPELKDSYAAWLAGGSVGYWAWIDTSSGTVEGVTASISSITASGSASVLLASIARYVIASLSSAEGMGSSSSLAASYTRYIQGSLTAFEASSSVTPLVANSIKFSSGDIASVDGEASCTPIVTLFSRYVTASLGSAEGSGSSEVLLASYSEEGVTNVTASLGNISAHGSSDPITASFTKYITAGVGEVIGEGAASPLVSEYAKYSVADITSISALGSVDSLIAEATGSSVVNVVAELGSAEGSGFVQPVVGEYARYLTGALGSVEASGTLESISAAFAQHATASISGGTCLGTSDVLSSVVARYISGAVSGGSAVGNVNGLSASTVKYITASLGSANASGSVIPLVASYESLTYIIYETCDDFTTNSWGKSADHLIADGSWYADTLYGDGYRFVWKGISAIDPALVTRRLEFEITLGSDTSSEIFIGMNTNTAGSAASSYLQRIGLAINKANNGAQMFYGPGAFFSNLVPTLGGASLRSNGLYTGVFEFKSDGKLYVSLTDLYDNSVFSWVSPITQTFNNIEIYFGERPSVLEYDEELEEDVRVYTGGHSQLTWLGFR